MTRREPPRVGGFFSLSIFNYNIMDRALTIPEKLCYSTVRLEGFKYNGKVSSGTGFFFAFDESDKQYDLVILTNKHVVEDCKKWRFYLTPEDEQHLPDNQKLLLVVEIPNDKNNKWIFHPEKEVDLCALSISKVLNVFKNIHGKDAYYSVLFKKDIPKSRDYDSFSTMEEVVMVGYPDALWDAVNNKPIIRRGITATHPRLDYNGLKKFLIDLPVFPGSSGSPVLIVNIGGYIDQFGVHHNDPSRVFLLGLVDRTFQHEVKLKDVFVKVGEEKLPIEGSVLIPNDLGYVIKAERILELEEFYLSSK